jgi:hypothetical protein
MKLVHRLLLFIHIFVGIGALAGGMAAIWNPTSPMGMPAAVLKHSPFDTFLIPGLILFGVVGLGSFFSAWMLYRKARYTGYISSVFSWALVIWIIVQCILLQDVVFLHVLYFVLGLIEAALAAAIVFEQRLFPASLMLNLLGRNKRIKQ